jgi:hypothetical protein
MRNTEITGTNRARRRVDSTASGGIHPAMPYCSQSCVILSEAEGPAFLSHQFAPLEWESTNLTQR